MWGDDLHVAVALLDLGEVLLQTHTQCGSLGQPQGQALAYVLREGKELHLLAELAVVALLGLFDELEVFVEHRSLGEGDAIDAVHLRVLVVAAPEGTGYAQHLAGLDGGRGGKVWATTEVGEVALGVGRDLAVLELGDELALEGLALGAELLEHLSLGHVATHDGLLLAGQLHHLLLDLGEVGLLDVLAIGRHDVVVEAVLDGRTDAELDAGIELLQRLGEQVGRRVPEGVLALVGIPLVEIDGGISGDGTCHVPHLVAQLGHEHILCKTRADRLSHLEGRYAILILPDRLVGKSQFDHRITNFYMVCESGCALCAGRLTRTP